VTTRQEFAQIAAILQTAYPRDIRPKDVLETYFALLRDIDGQALAHAAVMHARTGKWYPSVSELRDLATYEANAPDAASAWHEVHSGINSYEPEPEWSSPAIAEAVKVFGDWGSWCRSAKEADRGHNQRRFSEAYAAAVRRLKEAQERASVLELQAGGMLRLEE
jgi:hypothetical protein